MKTAWPEAKIVSIKDARARFLRRSRPRQNREAAAPSPNVWTCKDCDEITEELLQFHPVFRYLAE